MTLRVSSAGNIALQAEHWTLSREEGKRLMAWMKLEVPAELGLGQYWRRAFGTPYHRMIQTGAASMEVTTGGFSSGEFSNWCAAAGVRRLAG